VAVLTAPLIIGQSARYVTEGVMVSDCWHRYEEDYIPEERTAAAATHAYGVDTNWYIDTGATDHITVELIKLTTHEKYNGSEQIHTVSGQGMKISILVTLLLLPLFDLYISKILFHKPQKALSQLITLPLITMLFLRFTPKYFFIKDQVTRSILLKRWCRRGLYPLPSESNKYAFGAVPSFTRWHSRLGHLSTLIVSRVTKSNKLPCLDESKAESVCDACQQAKSHQLPYNKSFSVSRHPLELIHSDVWGLAPESVGRKKYYASFIDDYIKFTWLYLIKHKSEVFHIFNNFKHSLKDNLIKK
jgi:hypothetical protein